MHCVQKWNENLATNAGEKRSPQESGLGAGLHCCRDTQIAADSCKQASVLFAIVFLWRSDLQPIPEGFHCPAQVDAAGQAAAFTPLRRGFDPVLKLQPTAGSVKRTSAGLLLFATQWGDVNSHQLQFTLQRGSIINAGQPQFILNQCTELTITFWYEITQRCMPSLKDESCTLVS